MRLTNKLIILFFLLFNGLTGFSVQANNSRQILLPTVKSFMKPGIVTGKFIVVKGGEIINSLEIIESSGVRYIKFLRGNKYYYLPESCTGKMPMSIAPGAALEIGRENLNNPLPFHYEPSDLTELTIHYTEGYKVFLRKEAAVAFISMAEDAKAEGIQISVSRGYQSVGAYAKKYLNSITIWGGEIFPYNKQRPGYSPLHTGTYLYVTSPEIRNLLDDHFAFTKAYKWLLENSQYYGFEFLKFDNDVDYQPFMLRFTGKNSLIFKVQEPVPYQVVFKNESLAIKKFHRTGLNIAYLVIHDSENSATLAMKYALKKYGGFGAEIVNLLRINKRNIGIKVGNKIIAVDPNRIFTDENALSDMGLWNRNDTYETFKKALPKIEEIRKALLNHINLKEKRYLIALHSNSPHGKLSIHTFIRQSIKKNYHLYVNPSQSKKSFYYVVNYEDFLYFKNKKMNVVCLKNWNPTDGSLAFIAHKQNVPYITIESAEGEDRLHRILLDAAVELVNIRLKQWSR